MKLKIIYYFFLAVLPCAACVEGYRLTESYFKKKMIPFPFENFGIVVGLGCFFWALGLVILVRTVFQKRRISE